MQGAVKDGFTKRDIYRNGWHLLNREQSDEACKELIESGWIRVVARETDGKPREEFIINPKLKTPNTES